MTRRRLIDLVNAPDRYELEVRPNGGWWLPWTVELRRNGYHKATFRGRSRFAVLKRTYRDIALSAAITDLDGGAKSPDFSVSIRPEVVA